MKVKDISAMELFWIIVLGILSAKTAIELLTVLGKLIETLFTGWLR